MISCIDYKPGTNTASFAADTPADISRYILPTTTEAGKEELEHINPINMGSDLTVISTASVYMLNSNDEWIKLG